MGSPKIKKLIMKLLLDSLGPNGQPLKICPVCSFKNYVSHLNPYINAFWQRPLKNKPKSGEIWYTAAVLGHNSIEKFMGKLSLSCDLSDYYTNHCIRVTGATNLTRNNFMAKQVMSVTGHKSIESLVIHQKVREDNKISMGISLTFSLLHPNEVHALQNIMEEDKKAKERNFIPEIEATQPMLALPLANVQQIAASVNPMATQAIVQSAPVLCIYCTLNH